jgi:hypothetical protein
MITVFIYLFLVVKLASACYVNMHNQGEIISSHVHILTTHNANSNSISTKLDPKLFFPVEVVELR